MLLALLGLLLSADPSFHATASRIAQAAHASNGAWDKLEHLTDRIGHRLSGSAALEQAVRWATERLRAEGHENVRAEPVRVPHWVRGVERAGVVSPVVRPLVILGLGGSAGTPPGGVEGELLVVRSLADLEKQAARARGRIVLIDQAMPPGSPAFKHYGEVGEIRGRGPDRASRLGAIAVLTRSLTARSLRTPHTGATWWQEGTRPIPAAAVSIEDADLLARLAARGPVRVRLALGARRLPDALSANVIAELRGRERPDEIVLIGAHLDSWDVGQGAHDDGAGCVMVMEALSVLRRLGLRPRRTIRAVLFTNEENGLRGARAYAAAHQAELGRHVAAIETDAGGFHPVGFVVDAAPAAVAELTALARLLEPVGATRIERSDQGGVGADLLYMRDAAFPQLGLAMDDSRYFDYHHTEADTLDKVDPTDLKKGVAAMAIMAYLIAELPHRLGDPRAVPPSPGAANTR